MIAYYLDPSGWVKCYFQENGTDWMQNLFAQKQVQEMITNFVGGTPTLQTIV